MRRRRTRRAEDLPEEELMEAMSRLEIRHLHLTDRD